MGWTMGLEPRITSSPSRTLPLNSLHRARPGSHPIIDPGRRPPPTSFRRKIKMGWTMGLEPRITSSPSQTLPCRSLHRARPGSHPIIDPGRPLRPISAGGVEKSGVDDGTRTHDDRDHNPGLYQLSYAHHIAVFRCFARRYGAPGRTRTCNPRLRRPMLYPVELRAQSTSPPDTAPQNDGRGRRIRTADPLLPKQMRYQTAPCPAFDSRPRTRTAVVAARGEPMIRTAPKAGQTSGTRGPPAFCYR